MRPARRQNARPARPRPPRATGTAWSLVGRGLVLFVGTFAAACGIDVHDGAGPRVPIANVTGYVNRAGLPADDLDVELRRADNAVTVAEGETAYDGSYAFYEVALGTWEVKVSGEETGDFDSVTRLFTIDREEERRELPPLDIDAAGATQTRPAEGAAHPAPTLFTSLTFAWVLPAFSTDAARAQVYDWDWNPVWSSDDEPGLTSIAWNGLTGNEGDYAGDFAPPGRYRWRVKFYIGDSLEARTDTRELVLE